MASYKVRSSIGDISKTVKLIMRYIRDLGIAKLGVRDAE